jgi:hypothetical protein
MVNPITPRLEHFQKNSSHSVEKREAADLFAAERLHFFLKRSKLANAATSMLHLLSSSYFLSRSRTIGQASASLRSSNPGNGRQTK